MTFSKLIRSYSFILLITFSIIGCEKNDEGKDLIREPAGEAEFKLNNQLDKDVVAIYKLRSNSEEEFIDTTEIISSNTSIKFYETASFGHNPTPEDSFEEIHFYESSDLNNPLLSISPVENDNWEIIEQDLEESGYGFTVYNLILKYEDIE